MQSGSVFQQILEEKMGISPSEAPSSPSEKAPESPFYDPAKVVDQSWMHTIPLHSWAQPHKRKLYPKSPVKPITPKKTKTKKTKPSLPTHSWTQLSDSGQRSLRTLIKMGATIDQDKIQMDLVKKEYRRLAKIWHPDQNPTPEASSRFQRLHKAHRNLHSDLVGLSKK